MNKPPKAIKKPNPYLLYCEWDDGYKATISLEKFREGCPCAQCQKDRLIGKEKFNFPTLKTYNEGMNELEKLEPIGNYAIKAQWGDGHNAGIYTWETLRKIFVSNALKPEEIEKFMEL